MMDRLLIRRVLAVIAILLCGLFSLAQISTTADREVLLIPRGYTGDIYIVYRIKSGQPPLREDGARLYRIPSNGILLTQEEPNTGINAVSRFYYEDQSGAREPLERIWASTVPDTPQNRAHPQIEIFYPRRGRYGSTQMGCEVEHSVYLVGTRAQAISEGTQPTTSRLDEVIRGSGACEGQAPFPRKQSLPPPPRAIAPPRGQATPGDQHLTVLYGSWNDGPIPLQVEDLRMQSLLLATDNVLLNESLKGGRVVIRGSHASNTVETPRARMIVLFTGPLARVVNLPQPDASNVIYVQNGDGFRPYPSGVRVRDRAVELTPYIDRPGVLRLWVEHASGSRSGGDIVVAGR
jgi:hypothetical protein